MSRCDRCGCLLDEALDEYRVDGAGVWCVECHELMLAESLESVGGRQLIEAEDWRAPEPASVI